MRLTADEIKVVTFILVALLVGTAAKNYRSTHPEVPKASPVPRYQQHRPW